MNRSPFVVLGAVAATIAVAQPAQAQTAPTGWNDASVWSSLFTFSGCGGSNFATCMSVDLRLNSDGKTVGAHVLNNGGPGVFTRIGLVNLGGTVDEDAAGTTSSTAKGEWNKNANNGLSGDGLLKTIWAFTAKQGINGGLDPLQDGYFTFAVDNLISSQIGLAVHAQGGPNDCSTKFGVWQSGGGLVTNDRGPNGYDSGCGTTTRVPEPEGWALLLTGILGLGFVASWRRGREIA